MNMRTINRQLIVHNDLALGKDPVVQTRGDTTAAEQMIELNFIFRTVDKIRYLDFSKYLRVSLHTDGPLIQYWFDELSSAVDDGYTVLAPLPVVSFGRWLKTGATPLIISSDTAGFEDVTNVINTSNIKQVGLQVWNSTVTRPVYARGSLATDPWMDGEGLIAHIPV